MNTIEQELGIGEESEIIVNPANVKILPERKTGIFFVAGNYYDNLEDVPKYKRLIIRNQD